MTTSEERSVLSKLLLDWKWSDGPLAQEWIAETGRHRFFIGRAQVGAGWIAEHRKDGHTLWSDRFDIAETAMLECERRLARDKVEAELRSGVEAELRSGVEAELRSGVEAELRSGVEAELRSPQTQPVPNLQWQSDADWPTMLYAEHGDSRFEVSSAGVGTGYNAEHRRAFLTLWALRCDTMEAAKQACEHRARLRSVPEPRVAGVSGATQAGSPVSNGPPALAPTQPPRLLTDNPDLAWLGEQALAAGRWEAAGLLLLAGYAALFKVVADALAHLQPGDLDRAGLIRKVMADNLSAAERMLHPQQPPFETPPPQQPPAA